MPPYCTTPQDYLSDTPHIARYGVLVAQHGQLGAIRLSPFLRVSPLESMRSGGAIPPPPPQKGYLSDTYAMPHENKANGCDTPLCNTISKRCCTIWGCVSHWAAKFTKKRRTNSNMKHPRMLKRKPSSVVDTCLLSIILKVVWLQIKTSFTTRYCSPFCANFSFPQFFLFLVVASILNPQGWLVLSTKDLLSAPSLGMRKRPNEEQKILAHSGQSFFFFFFS